MNYWQLSHLKRILEWFDRYRDGSLDAWGLAQNLGAISGSIEGDIPQDVRTAIENGAGEVEFAALGEQCREQDRVERVRAEIRALIRQ